MENAVNYQPQEVQIMQFVHAAQEYVRRTLGILIDTSEESLAYVDHYVTTIRGQGTIKPEVVQLLGTALGVHLGQVLLQRMEGHWYGPLYATAEEQGNPLNWRIELKEIPLSFSPVAMALAVIQEEEPEELDSSLHTEQRWKQALADALERATPVTEDYYYSITGRYETVLFAAELLTEIRQQAKLKRQASSS